MDDTQDAVNRPILSVLAVLVVAVAMAVATGWLCRSRCPYRSYAGIGEARAADTAHLFCWGEGWPLPGCLQAVRGVALTEARFNSAHAREDSNPSAPGCDLRLRDPDTAAPQKGSPASGSGEDGGLLMWTWCVCGSRVAFSPSRPSVQFWPSSKTDPESLGFDHVKRRSRTHSGEQKSLECGPWDHPGVTRGPEGWGLGGTPRGGASTVSPGRPGGGGQRASPKVLLTRSGSSWTPGRAGKGAAAGLQSPRTVGALPDGKGFYMPPGASTWLPMPSAQKYCPRPHCQPSQAAEGS